MRLIALGINQAKTTEPEALNQALRNLEVDTSTPVSYTHLQQGNRDGA